MAGVLLMQKVGGAGGFLVSFKVDFQQDRALGDGFGMEIGRACETGWQCARYEVRYRGAQMTGRH